MSIHVGVLALQGAYQKHIDLLSTLKVSSSLVRTADELKNCNALILPGGESTTMSKLLEETELYEPVRLFAQNHAVMGVCAGMILMAEEVDDSRVKPLRLLAFKALRNFYGRQVNSFTTDIELSFDESKTYHAHFIRAPGITELSPDITVLASHNKKPILICSGKHMATSFHPELTNDTRIHEYWLSKLNNEYALKN